MRRLLLVPALAVIAITAAACASSTGPGWTYAPPTEAPPSQPAPSADASTAPSEAPASAAPTDAGSGGGDATVVQISALNIAFEQSEVSAPADTPFTIHFNNKDASTPHNVEIKDASGMQKFMGAIVTGPIETDYSVPPLPAGTYQFVCTVHPNMIGTLTVGG